MIQFLYMSWCFGLVNNRLAEIFFEKRKGKVKFLGHAFVKKSEYKTKQEKQWIKEDIKRVMLSYKNGAYKEL